jgi:hypothetical protein
MSVGLASRIEDLVGRRQSALEANRAISHQLSAVSFPSEGLAPAEKRDFIGQVVALSPGSN